MIDKNDQRSPHPSSKQSPPQHGDHCHDEQQGHQRPVTGPTVSTGRSGLSSPDGYGNVSPAKHGHAAPAGERTRDLTFSLGPCRRRRPLSLTSLRAMLLRKLDRLTGDDKTTDVLFRVFVAETKSFPNGVTKTRFVRWQDVSYLQVGRLILHQPENVADFYRSPITPRALTDAVTSAGKLD